MGGRDAVEPHAGPIIASSASGSTASRATRFPPPVAKVVCALRIACAGLALATAAAATDARPAALPAVITGEVTYRERLALPAGAELRVRLVDALPDQPAEVVAERVIRPTGNVPIRFELPFDRRRINPSRRYVVDARLTAGYREWVTIEPHPVLTGGAPATVSIVVH